jgi:hypothetical protein
MGTVSDANAGVLPGATITLRHLATGTTRVVVTDEQPIPDRQLRLVAPGAVRGEGDFLAAAARPTGLPGPCMISRWTRRSCSSGR